MCGLWGFHGSAGGADADLLEQAATIAARRGPDSWGVWADGALTTGAGRMPPGEARKAALAHLVVGHARLSTMLGTKTPSAAQPLLTGQNNHVLVAHNGSVRNYEQLRPHLALLTGNDSEALGAAVAEELSQGVSGLHEATMWALHRVDLGEVFAFVLAAGHQVLLGAAAQALYTLTREEGTYWCSVALSPDWERVVGLRLVGSK